MNQTITYEHLILYAYNETDFQDAVSAQNAIDGDPLVEQAYREITETMNYLDKFISEPSEYTLSNIFALA